MTGHDDTSGRPGAGPAHEVPPPGGRRQERVHDDPRPAPRPQELAPEGDLDGVDEALALVGPRDRQPGRAAPGAAPPGAAAPARHCATSWPEARSLAARIGRAAAPRTRSAALGDALGQVMAEPLVALCDLPSFDTSAMDGWAVAGPGPWRLDTEASVLAGHGETRPLPDGTAVRIATGARVPPGTTAVIRSEHARAGAAPQQLHAEREVVPGQDIRPRGQECRAGDQLLPSGSQVTPAVLGLAAAAGYDHLVTVARPRVEVLVLGDELLTSGLPHDGLIRDALGPMIGPWLASLGAEVVATGRIGDDAEALHRAVTTSDADLLITTGGTAAGPVDHVHPVLRKAGAELLVDGVAVRPGHPMLLARLAPGRHLVGLPGNPLAAVSGLLTLAEPLLRGLCGRPPAVPYRLPVRDAVHGHPHDTRLVPFVHGEDLLVPLHYNGPAMLRGIAAADGLAVVPPGGAGAGDELEVLDLPWAAWTPPTAEGGRFT
ncbi:molybdopterin molybdotransferase [Streptomyces sp. V4I23]|uniref:molybdopterin molybdotransferase MoeA n=1 Tax=Streptomyces sp. V4I23 TaxID=3042282 RepID=UPI002785F169|nr:molybdopterin molybdotransferase MoeA [Streptomyces sp. V4I23]MDQ1009613.1 molybdopterin molybdotransferase [Streptomyces sp. V4I23]